MQLKKNGSLAVMVVMSALCAAPSLMATAHADTPPLIGVVDEDKLGEKYTAYRTEIEKLDKKAQGIDDQLAAREFMSDAQGTTFDTLAIKATRTPAEETQFQGLLKAGIDLRTQYMALLPKATRTDAETKLVKSTEDQVRANAAKSRALSDQLYSDLKKQQEDIDKTFTDKANNVIGQVAADKKMLAVLRQRVVIWNAPATDITDEVVKRLNG